MKSLEWAIRYDVEHDLFHPQNVFSDEYITPTFVEYVRKLEQKLEQTEKDLADYQFNYPTIKELEQENKTLEGCLLAEQKLTQTLEKEKCELLGIIQEKDKVIEKMKCCNNCKHRYYMDFKPICAFNKAEIKDIENPVTCKCDKWELKE